MDGYLCIVKNINYDLNAIWYDSDWQAVEREVPLKTFHEIASLTPEFNLKSRSLLNDAVVTQNPRGCAGIEDLRLFKWNGQLKAIGAAIDRDFIWTGDRWLFSRELTTQCMVSVDSERISAPFYFESPTGAKKEKNWTPPSFAQGDLGLIPNWSAQVRVQLGSEDHRVTYIGEPESPSEKSLGNLSTLPAA